MAVQPSVLVETLDLKGHLGIKMSNLLYLLKKFYSILTEHLGSPLTLEENQRILEDIVQDKTHQSQHIKIETAYKRVLKALIGLSGPDQPQLGSQPHQPWVHLSQAAGLCQNLVTLIGPDPDLVLLICISGLTSDLSHHYRLA